MRKKFFLVGALVVMSMSAMFVACNGNNPTNGCICTATYENGETETESITLAKMKEEFGITSCAELTTLENQLAELKGISSVTCSAY